MPARRSLPDYPSLRYLKVEAKERTRSGELAALHEAQLAIAGEHGLPGWPALCRLAGQQVPAQSWVLPHVRWLISRFRDAGEPGWAPPDDSEARQHFSGEFLDVVDMQELFEIIAGDAARPGEELLVLALTPRTGRFRHVGREIWVGVEAEPPHLLGDTACFPAASPQVQFNALATEWERSETDAAPPPRQSRRQADGSRIFPRMAPAWAGDRATGSAVSLSTPTMTTGPRKLNSKPKRRATRVAAWLTCFPAAAPSSSSQASQRLVTWIRSAQSVPMSALRERMNRVAPPGRSTSLGGPSTGMRRAFTARSRAGRGHAGCRAG
jgi:hypothetical protein